MNTSEASRARRVATGTLAAVTLVAVTVGVPVALAWLGGDPLPHHVPTAAAARDSLLRKDVTGMVFVRLLVVIGWLAWATFALSIVVELIARLRGRTAMRVPGLGGPQRFAAGLVAAIAIGIGSPASAMAAPHAPVAAVAPTAPDSAAPDRAPAGTVPDIAPASTAPPHDAHVVYQVRKGDYLGRIAERFGEPFDEATEIARANHIKDPNLIDVGWKITLPDGAADSGAHRHATGRVVAGTETSMASDHQAPADDERPAQTGNTSATPAGASQAASPTSAPSDVEAPVPTAVPADGFAGEMLAASGTLAAVVSLAVVVMRRRDHMSLRLERASVLAAVGGDVPRLMAPTRVEDIIRLDDALRVLADRVSDWPSQAVPQVAGVWLDHGAVTMLLAGENRGAPEPFVDDPNGWRLDAGTAIGRATDQIAPLPLLCVIGGRDRQHALLDLEYVRVLGVGGDHIEAMNLLRFVVAELCHNVWSDDVGVTLAGFGADADGLAAFDPARIRVEPSIPAAIAAFHQRLAEAVANLHDVRPPGVLVVASPSSEDRGVLASLERDLMAAPGVGMAVVVAPTLDGVLAGTYQMTVDARGDLRIPFLGDALMPAASLPATLVGEVASLLDEARRAGRDATPLDLARAASRSALAQAPGGRAEQFAGRRRVEPGARSFRAELDELTRRSTSRSG
jgi:LysM repeat protein